MNVKAFKQTLDEFTKWFNELSPMDKANFLTLISLPNARKVVQNMSDVEYRESGLVALMIIDFANGLNHE